MQLTALDRFLWAAGFGAHLALVFVLVFRGRIRQFPFFSSLIITNILRTAILYFVRSSGSRSDYFYAFWSLAILDTGLQILVVYEVSAKTFRPLGVWATDVRGRFLGVLASAIGVAFVLTWLAAPRASLWVQVVVIRGNFFSSMCLTELFVGMTALSVQSGLPWKSHVARISRGLAAYSAIDVVIEVGHSFFGTSLYTMLSHFRMGAYLVCVCYWIVTLWMDAAKPRKMPDQLLRQLLQLQTIVDSDLQEIRARQG